MADGNEAAVRERYRRLKNEFYGRPSYGTRVMRAKGGEGYDTRDSDVDWDEELAPYHTSRGWYDVPGAEKKLRKDDAIKALKTHKGYGND